MQPPSDQSLQSRLCLIPETTLGTTSTTSWNKGEEKSKTQNNPHVSPTHSHYSSTKIIHGVTSAKAHVSPLIWLFFSCRAALFRLFSCSTGDRGDSLNGDNIPLQAVWLLFGPSLLSWRSPLFFQKRVSDVGRIFNFSVMCSVSASLSLAGDFKAHGTRLYLCKYTRKGQFRNFAARIHAV